MMRINHLKLNVLLLMTTVAVLASCGDDGEDPIRLTMSGHIAGDTVLTAGSQIVFEGNTTFSGDVVVEAGCVLELAPECNVVFQQSLLLDGRANQHLKIKAAESTRYASFRFDGDSLIASYVDFSGGDIGLQCSGITSQISNCTFKDCYLGIYNFQSHFIGHHITVQNGTLGIISEQSQLALSHSQIHDCETAVEFTRNHGTVEQCSFTNNYTALHSLADDSTIFRNNLMSHNFYGANYYYGYPLLFENNITNNDYGIIFYTYPRWFVEIKRNNIMDNLNFGLKIYPGNFNNPHMLYLPDNWWGSADSATIAASIFDGFDTGEADSLVFVPFATEAWPAFAP